MDYEKEYKKRLDDARYWHDVSEGDILAVLEEIFPELKESEYCDERIRKAIILAIKDNITLVSMNGFSKNDMIAWLEKLKVFTEHGDGLYHFGNSEFTYVGNPTWDYVSFPENQGEQKPVVIIPKFRVGDEVTTENEESLTITRIDEEGYWSNDLFICGFDDSAEWELVEQKPDNKIEPKFHEGEWITFTRKDDTREVLQISDIIDGRYHFNHLLHFSWSIKECNKKCHLWTIQDARDGDVLAYVTDEEDLWIMIYWSLYEPYEGHVHYHALLANNNFSNKGTCCICIDDLHPATKDQRDLLFQKMHEAGYMWDSKSKQLLSLKAEPSDIQTPTEWSEEDKLQLQAAIEICENSGHITTSDWLKSIKDKVQPKVEWSEEDEERLTSCLNILRPKTLLGTVDTINTRWLESLRERMGG